MEFNTLAVAVITIIVLLILIILAISFSGTLGGQLENTTNLLRF